MCVCMSMYMCIDAGVANVVRRSQPLMASPSSAIQPAIFRARFDYCTCFASRTRFKSSFVITILSESFLITIIALVGSFMDDLTHVIS